jgi:protein-disulfide isomerase
MSRINTRSWRSPDLTIAAAALVLAASVASRVFFVGGSATDRSRGTPVANADWREAVRVGVPIHESPVSLDTIIEWIDFECPACRAYQPLLGEVVERLDGRVTLIYAAVPLRGRRNSPLAAQAMECADSVGAADRWLLTALQLQDSIDELGYSELGRRAGINADSWFEACALRQPPADRLRESISLAERARVTATPTLWVNGRQFVGGLALDPLLNELKGGRAVERRKPEPTAAR